MKRKISIILMIVLAITLVISCKTPASSSGPSRASGASAPPSAAENIEAALSYVYDQYRGDIILEGAASYTVVSGDTLAHISQAQYGNGFYFPLIMLASSDVVVDQDKIQPGMTLTVPDLQRNLNDTNAKRRIKAYLLDIARIEDERGRPADGQGLRDLSGTL